MVWTIITPPTSEPVSLDDARLHVREDEASANPQLLRCVQAARQHVEQVCERALMPQTWRLSLGSFPDSILLPGGLVRQVESITYWDNDLHSATYVRSGNTVTVMLASHGYVVGDALQVEQATDSGLVADQTVATVPGSGSFTFTTNSSGALSGSLQLRGQRQTLSGAQQDLEAQPARILPPLRNGWPAVANRANAVQIRYQAGYADASKVPEAIKAAILLIAGNLYENREGAIVGTSIADNPAVNRLLMPYKRVVP